MNSNNTYVFHLSLYKKFIKLLFNEISVYDAITDKPFRIKQSEVRNIYRSSKQSKYFIELERDKESFFFSDKEFKQKYSKLFYKLAKNEIKNLIRRKRNGKIY